MYVCVAVYGILFNAVDDTTFQQKSTATLRLQCAFRPMTKKRKKEKRMAWKVNTEQRQRYAVGIKYSTYPGTV